MTVIHDEQGRDGREKCFCFHVGGVDDDVPVSSLFAEFEVVELELGGTVKHAFS